MKLHSIWLAIALTVGVTGVAHAGCPNGPTINLATDGNGNGCVVESVSGIGVAVTDTPPVQAAAYASGNCVSGFRPVTLASGNGGVIELTGVTITSLSGQTAPLTLLVFDSNPSSSTCTDRGTFSLNVTADGGRLRRTYSLTPGVPVSGANLSTATQTISPPAIMYAGGSTGSGVETIYYALVAGATLTPGSTSDIKVILEGQH